MSNLVKKDPGSGVVSEVGNTAVTAGVTTVAIVVSGMLPVFGWVPLVAGGGYLLLRAYRRGRGNR